MERCWEYVGTILELYITLWLFNIAMENPQNKWRFLAGKIIYKWAINTMAMLNNQRVNIYKS
jgi:hypothetical protein